MFSCIDVSIILCIERPSFRDGRTHVVTGDNLLSRAEREELSRNIRLGYKRPHEELLAIDVSTKNVY